MILARHVTKTTGLTMVGATILLLMLQVFFNYIAEVSKLSADYTALKALKFVLWQAPELLYYTLPISVLVGAVVGLGMMSAASELVVMRASGVSVWRIVSWVLKPAFGFAIFALILSQWILPYSQAKSISVRYMDGGVHQAKEVYGYWMRDGQNFVFIEYANTDGEIRNLKAMQLNADLQLVESFHAATGTFLSTKTTQAPKVWQLHDVFVATTQADGAMQGSHLTQKDMLLDLQPKYVQIMTKDPEQLKPSVLYQYIRYLAHMGKVPARYTLALWQMLSAPIGLMAIVMLACSFVFGPQRQLSMGLRIVIALFVGLGFKYGQEFLGYASLVSTWSPGWFVMLPIFGVLSLSVYFLKKVR